MIKDLNLQLLGKHDKTINSFSLYTHSKDDKIGIKTLKHYTYKTYINYNLPESQTYNGEKTVFTHSIRWEN
jgi:hypothetical protein